MYSRIIGLWNRHLPTLDKDWVTVIGWELVDYFSELIPMNLRSIASPALSIDSINAMVNIELFLSRARHSLKGDIIW